MSLCKASLLTLKKDEIATRAEFERIYGSFLPSNLWSSIGDRPIRYQVRKFDDPEVDAEDKQLSGGGISSSSVAAAEERMRGRMQK